MIGNSLSFCVDDIIEGNMKESDVELIRCSFRKPENYSVFRERCIKHYQSIYWRKNPRRAKRIARRLFKQQRLIFTGGHYLEQKWTETQTELKQF